MFKKIRGFLKEKRQYRETKKALTLILMNQYSDFLVAQKNAAESEEEAYRSMNIFSETFNPEDLRNLITSVNTIANSPQLQTDYFKQVNRNAHEERMKADK